MSVKQYTIEELLELEETEGADVYITSQDWFNLQKENRRLETELKIATGQPITISENCNRG